MAATDQFYRDQNTLDKIFAGSSIVMLISVIWMFAQDYYRPFKSEQRSFRDVESALAQRLALQQLPSEAQFKAAREAVEKARDERKKKQAEIDQLKAEYWREVPKKEKAEFTYQDFKAKLDSRLSFYDIEVEHHGPASALAQRYRQEIEELKKEVEKAKRQRDKHTERARQLQQKITELEEPLTRAMSHWKQVNDQFETQVKAAVNKQWGLSDFIRALPILDGFASPIKIQQFTLETLPIDYNFKHVTRFDRCTTCHLGIDRPTYTKENLRALRGDITPDERKRLEEAHSLLKARKETLDSNTTDWRMLPYPSQLGLTKLSPSYLTEARINQFCAHPRLELFVHSNSKHPMEKFGCTTCHSGQGSGTEFSLSGHYPNSTTARKRWVNEHGWETNHYWDFPMLPLRFVEASCLKCHHHVTDLIGPDNKNEAPKLIRGYNLIREAGCFGCHEIHGRKNNRPVGPDLRLEAYPPLESLTAAERNKILADPDTAPGNLRKVGPSLFRLAEKTSEEWTARWLRAPREFRPDTKMPHFYGLSNNDPKYLPEDQKAFPDAEMQAITYFLFEESRAYLRLAREYNGKAEKVAEDQKRHDHLVRKQEEFKKSGGPRLTLAEEVELDDLKYRLFHKLDKAPVPIADAEILPEYAGDRLNGRQLFVERGCLSCHRHDGTSRPEGKNPAVESEATFAPNLSQLRAKFGTSPEEVRKARNWLRHWIKNPQRHSPRSVMPVTHMTDQQIADVVAWLLEQEPRDLGKEWPTLKVAEPNIKDDKEAKVYYDLAEVYLKRQISEDNLETLRTTKKLDPGLISDLPLDERKLAADYSLDNVRYYVGKKAIFRLGCFGCHDIPRFESAKPIGTALNDWGKKNPERLTFEDIVHYVKKHYNVVESMEVDDPETGKKKPAPFVEEEQDGKKIVKKPYEKFFFDALKHKQREGFLHQKLVEPRSFDYNRLRPWDDRARMPQFQFTRQIKKKKESEADFQARAWKEEAEAREAVMTFVLGLVAEQIPMQHVHQPKNHRLAEVKGRQVLERFNCAGCHILRPGIFQFKSTPETRLSLTTRYNALQRSDAWKGDYPEFAPDFRWQGDPSAAGKDVLTAYGIPSLEETDDEKNPYRIRLRLAQSLQFPVVRKQGDGKEVIATGEQGTIRAGDIFYPPMKDMVYPPAEYINNGEHLVNLPRNYGPWGGAFSDLLVKHLTAIDTVIYAKDQFGDSKNARAAGPPPLIGQGRRTQPEWLYQFLLDPHPVRKMAVLQMPKFNMSEEEARALVDYFAAVEAQVNERVHLEYPYPTIEQQVDLDSAYWKEKTARYVKRLEDTKVKGADGKETTAYQQRLAELKSVWQQIAQDYLKTADEAEAKFKASSAKLKEAETVKKAAEKALQEEKDEAKKADLRAALARADVQFFEAKRIADSWEDEARRARDKANESTPDKLLTQWKQKEAYITDGYRLLVNRNLCLTCHRIGQYQIGKAEAGQGPPLEMAEKRLRPDWVRMWVGHPNRFLTYDSVMLAMFPKNETKYQEFFVGTPLEQITAIRDVLMIHQRAADLPLNRYWALPLTGEKK